MNSTSTDNPRKVIRISTKKKAETSTKNREDESQQQLSFSKDVDEDAPFYLETSRKNIHCLRFNALVKKYQNQAVHICQGINLLSNLIIKPSFAKLK